MIASLLCMALAACMSSPGQAPRITDAPDTQPIVVETDKGPVRGAASAEGQVFLGIPFAAPPTGPRRFAAPQPAAAWETVRPATDLAPGCPQALPVGERAEDCLYLNIYAPSDATADAALPVMVWFYGGGLVFGANTQYDGSRLAESQDVVVVVPNYRLGALGFLAHPALAGPGEGNYGMLDQRAALAWVRRNIAAFGGAPSRVTLFGQSAGATSACTHMVSPGSRGLFHGVILQSDTCVFPDQSVARAVAEQGGTQTAHDLGCGEADDVVACLRALPADDFVGVDSHYWGNTGKNGWSPMIGGDVLPAAPRAVFARGEAADVPLLMGSNRTEGRFFGNLLSLTLAWRSRSSYEAAVARTIKPDVREAALAAYDDQAAVSYYRAFSSMLTDSHFACPMLTLHGLRAQQSANDYVYEFDDPQAPTIVPHIPFTPPQQAYHSAELTYVFQHGILFADPDDWTPAQRALSDRIQAYWGAFAATGRPGWPVFDGRRPWRLAPEGHGLVEDFATRHRCDVWHPLGY